ncbi:hypothetical protein, partial [Paraburkholderia sp. 2C]
FLVVNPCIPDSWPGFEATVHMHSTRYEIHVKSALGHPAMRIVLDGQAVDCSGNGVYAPLDAGSHTLIISICSGVAEEIDSPEPAV